MDKVFELQPDHKIYIAGHKGMVGSAIWRALLAKGYSNLIGKSSSELDLRDAHLVNAFFESEKPDVVFLAAAKVGGIVANNTYPVEFITDNLRIQTNVIDAAWRFGTKRLLFLGSSCIYPKFAPQPIKEEYLLTGELEPTNEAYAIAKIAGIKQIQAYRKQYGASFISAMPTNLYGPGDNYNLETSHVIPALIRKFHEAKLSHSKTVEIWGTGSPRREFLYADDLADASIHLIEYYDDGLWINIGYGNDISILELAEQIARTVGFEGSLVFDSSKPDGTPRKLLDTTKINQLNWIPKTNLQLGLQKAYKSFLGS